MKFTLNWKVTKRNWGVNVGLDYNYMNLRGEGYQGVHIFSIYFLTLDLRWIWPEKMKISNAKSETLRERSETE